MINCILIDRDIAEKEWEICTEIVHIWIFTFNYSGYTHEILEYRPRYNSVLLRSMFAVNGVVIDWSTAEKSCFYCQFEVNS